MKFHRGYTVEQTTEQQHTHSINWECIRETRATLARRYFGPTARVTRSSFVGWPTALRAGRQAARGAHVGISDHEYAVRHDGALAVICEPYKATQLIADARTLHDHGLRLWTDLDSEAAWRWDCRVFVITNRHGVQPRCCIEILPAE